MRNPVSIIPSPRPIAKPKMLRLVMESAKCTHLYHYYQHPEIGADGHPGANLVSLQRGRVPRRSAMAEPCQLDRAGIDYQQRNNCFICIEDRAAAQQLLDEQLRSNWPALMNSLLEIAHPSAWRNQTGSDGRPELLLECFPKSNTLPMCSSIKPRNSKSSTPP